MELWTSLLLSGMETVSEWDKNRAHRAWDRVRRAVGLAKDPEAVLHACRHTCASRLVQAGVPIQVVQQWLGHRTLTMTLKYAHLAPVNLLQAVQALDKTVTTSTDKVRLHSDTEPLVTTVTTVTTSRIKMEPETAIAG